jgi:hypothetical protein
VGIVLVAEGDVFTVEVEQAVVGDGDAMGIAAEPTLPMLTPMERTFAISRH